MRTLIAASLALALGAAASQAAAPAQIVLSDPGYPLWEMRPLDRHVYVLTLEGDWKTPPDRDAAYSVNIEFPDGTATAHRPTNDRLFRRGDVECLLIEYQLEKHHFVRGDRLTIFITRRDAASAPDDQEVVSNRLEVEWPLDRKVTRLPPRTRFTPPEPVDTFHPADELPPVPVPKPMVAPAP